MTRLPFDDRAFLHQANLRLCMSAAIALATLDIPKMLESIERADALGPMLDPTLWMQKSEAMSQDREMLKAALPLWKFAKQMEANDGN